jgi:hypothetical protein
MVMSGSIGLSVARVLARANAMTHMDVGNADRRMERLRPLYWTPEQTKGCSARSIPIK